MIVQPYLYYQWKVRHAGLQGSNWLFWYCTKYTSKTKMGTKSIVVPQNNHISKKFNQSLKAGVLFQKQGKIYIQRVASIQWLGKLKQLPVAGFHCNLFRQASLYSRTSAITVRPPLYNGHFFSSTETKKPYIEPCLKPFYNGHLFTAATFFCSQGGRCREFQL